jgi:hypothetical protein
MASQILESVYILSLKYYGKRVPRVLQMTAFIFALTEFKFIFALTEFKKFHLLFVNKTDVTVPTYTS